MFSIVNYGSSDSENEISDEEQVNAPVVRQYGPKTEQKDEDLFEKPSTINLPQPSTKKALITEEDDEFLHKKEIPKVTPPPSKTKVKIMIPRLSEFKDDEDDKKPAKILPINKKSGLLSMLPKPSHSFGPSPKPKPVSDMQHKSEQNPSLPQHVKSKQQEAPTEAPKKVGLIPYALMSHKPKTADSKKQTKAKDQESDDDDDDETIGSFFTFSSNDDELPKVSEEEVKALIAKETARMEQRKRQNDETEPDQTEDLQNNSYEQQQQNVDEEAMKALLGGNKAKRSKIDNIQFIDLSAAEVMPNKDEWLRKSLAGETSYQPTGHISEKVRTLNIHRNDFLLITLVFTKFQGPSALAKRKHQISYLSMRAENNEAELEAMWASNRQTKREGKGKYGF